MSVKCLFRRIEFFLLQRLDLLEFFTILNQQNGMLLISFHYFKLKFVRGKCWSSFASFSKTKYCRARVNRKCTNKKPFTDMRWLVILKGWLFGYHYTFNEPVQYVCSIKQLNDIDKMNRNHEQKGCKKENIIYYLQLNKFVISLR